MTRNSPRLSTTDFCFIFQNVEMFPMLPSYFDFDIAKATETKWSQIV